MGLLEHLSRLTGVPAPRWQVPYPVGLAVAAVSEFWANRVTGRMPRGDADRPAPGTTAHAFRSLADPRGAWPRAAAHRSIAERRRLVAPFFRAPGFLMP